MDSASAALWIDDIDIRTMPPVMVVPPPLMFTCAVLSASSTPLTCPPPEKLKFPFWPIPTLPLIRNGPLLRLMIDPWSPSTANSPAAPSALQMLGGEQFKVAGLNEMFIVLNPAKVAEPENEVAQVRGPSDLLTVVLKLPLELAVTGIESLIVNAWIQVGMTSIEYVIVYPWPGFKAEALTEIL